jgi:hypothetical protein
MEEHAGRMMTPTAIRSVLCGLAGAIFAVAYFSGLAWNVRLYARDGIGMKAMTLHLSRLFTAAAMFTLCAKIGAAPLLASFAAFQAMRLIILKRFKPAFEAG